MLLSAFSARLLYKFRPPPRLSCERLRRNFHRSWAGVVWSLHLAAASDPPGRWSGTRGDEVPVPCLGFTGQFMSLMHVSREVSSSFTRAVQSVNVYVGCTDTEIIVTAASDAQQPARDTGMLSCGVHVDMSLKPQCCPFVHL